MIRGYEPMLSYRRDAPTLRKARGEPGYRGEAWTDEGEIRPLSWSPNRLVFRVRPGQEVFINQNPGSWWRVNGRPAFEGRRCAEPTLPFAARADDDGPPGAAHRPARPAARDRPSPRRCRASWLRRGWPASRNRPRRELIQSMITCVHVFDILNGPKPPPGRGPANTRGRYSEIFFRTPLANSWHHGQNQSVNRACKRDILNFFPGFPLQCPGVKIRIKVTRWIGVTLYLREQVSV